MRRKFFTLDVFTEKRFAGNPLAVVLEPDGLDTAAMQALAREFNLSETVFVFPPVDAANRAKLRIFTPGSELPFAGHPTVGTAVLLARMDGGGTRAFGLEETIGLVPCLAEETGQESGRARFILPKLPVETGPLLDIAAIASALNLTPDDIGYGDARPSRWSAGTELSFVPVKGLAAIARCRPDLVRFDAVFGFGVAAKTYVFCRETDDKSHHFHARMFAPSIGVMEDPATGAAAAAFAGFLAAHGGYADGEHLVRIEQGYEMGRPSLIELTLTLAGGKLAAASIGGAAVVVSEGAIEA